MSHLELVIEMIQSRLPYSCIGDISDHTGVAASTLYYWRDNELQRPSASVVERLAHYFGIPLTHTQLAE